MIIRNVFLKNLIFIIYLILNKQINKNLISIKAYLPDLPIEEIIKSCQLESYSNWRYWTDQLGNVLHVNDQKKFFISLNKERINITDIYLLSPMEFLKSISLKNFINDGKFYSFDSKNILRIREIENNKNIMPLELGVKELFSLFNP